MDRTYRNSIWLEKGEFAGTGKAFFELIHPEDRDYAIAAMRQAIETGQEYHAQYRIICT
uniref:PAS domain-containing protein n=1 Tax=Desertifilum tharense IPPAS B-1220 TaxID=1781255 RepID=A0ACD5H0T5_9CYAN